MTRWFQVTGARDEASWRRWPVLALLTLLTLTGAALRLWRLDWSLPFVPHPDEPAIMNVVLRMLHNADPNPHFFYYPSVWIYVQALVAWLHLKWGIAQGIYTGAAQLPETTDIATAFPGFFVWGRAATAIAGALTVPAVYNLALRIAGPIAGLTAAALLTFNAYHLVHSHYITTDVPATFFTGLALIATIQLLDRGRWRDYLLAGVLAGVAAGTKHNAALTAAAIAAAHALHWRRTMAWQFPRLLAAALAMIGAFLLTSPYIVLAFDEFRGDLTHQLGDYAVGAHGDVTGTWPAGAYFAFYRDQAMGLGGMLLVWMGVVRMVRRRDGRLAVLAVLTLVYLLIFMSQGNHWMRNLLPTQVALLAFAGAGMAELVALLANGLPRPAVAAAGAAVLLAALVVPAVEAAQYSRRLSHPDSRVEALRWIEAKVPPGVPVAAELKPVPGAGASRWTEVHYLPEHDLAWYRAQGYGYLVASSDTWRQLAIPVEYRALSTQDPIVEFPGAAAGRLGPRIVVYSTDVTSDAASVQPEQVIKIGGARLGGMTLGVPHAEEPHVGINPQAHFQPGDIVGLRTFWEVEQPFDVDYFIFVHVLDSGGNRVAQRDTPPWQGRFPTSSWQPGTLVVDVNDLALPTTLAEGTYEVVVGMFDPATGAGPPVTINGAAHGSNGVSAATLIVGAGQAPR